MDTNANYKAIIFDFFGVIASDVAGDWFKRNSERITRREPKEYSQIFRKLDVGDISTAQFFDELGRESGVSAKEIAEDMLADKQTDPGVIELIGELRKNYKVAILSNANAEWLEEILSYNNLNSYFDSITISSRVGWAKPDPEIFEIARMSLGIQFSEAIFVDDAHHNVVAANNLGMTAIKFTDADSLKNALGDLGVV